MIATRIDFGIYGNAERYCLGGFHPPERELTWSKGVYCSVRLQLPSSEQCLLVVQARPFVSPPALNFARVQVACDDILIGAFQSSRDFVVGLPLPRKTIGSFVNITFVSDDAASPARFGHLDSRSLGLAFRSITIVDMASTTKTIVRVLGDLPTEADKEISEWVAREFVTWFALPFDRQANNHALKEVNLAPWAQVYTIKGQSLQLDRKPTQAITSAAIARRSYCYTNFFRQIAKRLPASINVTFCVCLADQLHTLYDTPIMAFQKQAPSASILIPDVEFLENEYFEDNQFIDRGQFRHKTTKALFSGSTTGGVISRASITENDIPRISSARFFQDSSIVDFRLPTIVQCEDSVVRSELEKLPFCMKSRMTWAQHFGYKFLISIDGNGAACSRMAIALKSNSALLKYDSPHQLFYFAGITEATHYVRIQQDADVNDTIQAELLSPLCFQQIAINGSSFYHRHLRKERLIAYTEMAIRLLAHLQS